jgi:hypothetical protein
MLNLNDYKNLLIVLQRAQFKGLEEAEVGVVLAHRLRALIRASAPTQEVPNGPDAPNSSEQSPSPIG